MSEQKKKTWRDQFIENYNGTSKESKEIAEFMKENYKGNSYIPWATMERLTYMQDENAEFKTIETNDGNIVWTDSCENYNEVIADGTVKQGSKSVMFSHFVKVSLTFMGKTFIEEYPIQDQDYSALKIYNQNAVNKALKRALAKVASRGTGLGLRLYENKDLQFDTPVEETKPVVKKPTTKKTVEKVELTEEQKVQNIVDGGETAAFLNGERTFEPQEVTDINVGSVEPTKSKTRTSDVLELYHLIKDTDSAVMTKVLQTLNPAIIKKHNFVLSLEDNQDELCDKLEHLGDIKVFTNAIKRML